MRLTGKGFFSRPPNETLGTQGRFLREPPLAHLAKAISNPPAGLTSPKPTSTLLISSSDHTPQNRGSPDLRRPMLVLG